MKIFFTAAYAGKSKFQKYYDMVVKLIESTGVELISPEKYNYRNLLTKDELKSFKTEKLIHYEAIRKGIEWADAVIIEISQQDFQIGHEATLAMLSKKPVLCISLYENVAEKINNPYFFGAKYSEYNAEVVIKSFINNIMNEPYSERFNCFLSKGQLDYLDEASRKNNINKSEYLRALIDKDRMDFKN